MNIEYISGANFSRRRRIFSWQKKAGDRVGVGGCSKDEATDHQDQDQGPFATFFLASLCLSHNQDQPAKVWIDLDHLTWRLWILCQSISSVVGKSVCLYAFNNVDVIGAGVVLKLNDGSLRCLVRVRSRSQLAPGHGDHPWWSIGPPSQPAHWWWCCWWQWCFLSSH